MRKEHTKVSHLSSTATLMMPMKRSTRVTASFILNCRLVTAPPPPSSVLVPAGMPDRDGRVGNAGGREERMCVGAMPCVSEGCREAWGSAGSVSEFVDEFVSEWGTG